MVFELVTGDLLFDPHEGDGYDRDEGDLAPPPALKVHSSSQGLSSACACLTAWLCFLPNPGAKAYAQFATPFGSRFPHPRPLAPRHIPA